MHSCMSGNPSLPDSVLTDKADFCPIASFLWNVAALAIVRREAVDIDEHVAALLADLLAEHRPKACA